MKIKVLIWLANWICCLLDVVCGLIGFVTLTLYRPWWDFKFRTYTAKYIVGLRVQRIAK